MKLCFLLLFLFPFSLLGQQVVQDNESFPVFEECAGVALEKGETCFREQLKSRIHQAFGGNLLPDYSGEVVVLFEVTEAGRFQTVYIDAPTEDIKRVFEHFFSQLPVVEPPRYNGRPIDMQFRMPIRFPLQEEPDEVGISLEATDPTEQEFAEIIPQPSGGPETVLPEYSSELNIPLSHERYARFDATVNRVGVNFHTAVKPFLYSELRSAAGPELEPGGLQKPTDSWLGRKLWNEHLVKVSGEDFWFTVDLGLDLQVGKDFGSDLDVTYLNTRAAIIQGGLGGDFNFYSVIFESQGRFADYYNSYAESLRPGTEGVAVIPGRGIAKEFMGQAYDFPGAVGYLSYSPGKFFNLQFGHGKHFIGDGYRSLLLSDNAAPYPYFRLNTSFWKLKYTNTWMSLRDVRPEVTGEGSYRTKFMANHYLSLNLTRRLNIGLFESVIWENDNNRGFDLNYLNPVIFYRAIEFSTGAQAGNAIIGLTGKYKWSDRVMSYGQWLIDEFSSGDVFGGKGSWKNKHGFQLGTKYFEAFGVPGLQLQIEYNQVRPYTYSHNTITLNYGHTNQSMAHQWGANFREILGIARYKEGRWYGHLKTILGKRGFDPVQGVILPSYGGNIYRSEEDRPLETGVRIGQGNTTNVFYLESEIGYIINPATNLKFFTSFIFRNASPEIPTGAYFDDTTTWLRLGLRTDIFNWYYDY